MIVPENGGAKPTGDALRKLAESFGKLEQMKWMLLFLRTADRSGQPVPTPTPDRLMDAGEVAERLGITKRAVYRLHSKGEFPFARKIGHKLRFSEKGLKLYLDRKRIA